MNKKAVLINALIVLAVLNFLIIGKELLLRDGKEVFLELAPADPRSLLQGDYMTIRYRLSQEIYSLLKDEVSRDGYVLATLDEKRIARSPRLASADEKPNSNEVLLHFRKRGRTVRIATDAYFFQEGFADSYNRAKYGILRIDEAGHSVLAGLANEELQKLENQEASK
jgi:uncharacterized membrane-anchored protein